MAHFIRKGSAVWQGNGLEGNGSLTTPTGTLQDTAYSFKARFPNPEEKRGTNPEELIAAAHAGCFLMALSFQLAGAGFTADEMRCEATIHMSNASGGWAFEKITLQLDATIPSISAEQFSTLTNAAKEGCPVSKALSTVPIELQATLA